MATQVQIRRDSATNLAASTPVVGEAGYDTTNKNLIVGDGSRVGGIPHLSYKHDQTQRFRFASGVGGTADAITVTLNEPLDAYSQGVAIEFIAGSTNTGSTTVNVSSLGTKTIKKMSGGALADLGAGDIVSGGVYRLVYDGTYFQISSAIGGGIVINRQVFTSSGTYNKPSNLLYVDVEVIGGGGGGGGSSGAGGMGGGGGGGGYCRKVISASALSSSETVTLGSGGSAGTSGGGNGGTGGTSSFGSHCSAVGGNGGGGRNSTDTTGIVLGGAGGQGTNGDINGRGWRGLEGIRISSLVGYGGAGGSSLYGMGGQARISSSAGSSGSEYGGGGSGGFGSGYAGGVGAAGVVIVTEFLS